MSTTPVTATPLNYMLDVMCKRYEPAITASDSTEMITPADLLQHITAATTATSNEVTAEMIARGFILDCIDMRFVWLLKEKQQ